MLSTYCTTSTTKQHVLVLSCANGAACAEFTPTSLLRTTLPTPKGCNDIVCSLCTTRTMLGSWVARYTCTPTSRPARDDFSEETTPSPEPYAPPRLSHARQKKQDSHASFQSTSGMMVSYGHRRIKDRYTVHDDEPHCFSG